LNAAVALRGGWLEPGGAARPAPPAPVVLAPAEKPSSVRQAFLLGRKLDINRASWQKISELPGISDRVAQAVVETRRRIGRFGRPEDLMQVPGIKEKRLKKILPFLCGFGNN